MTYSTESETLYFSEGDRFLAGLDQSVSITNVAEAYHVANRAYEALGKHLQMLMGEDPNETMARNPADQFPYINQRLIRLGGLRRALGEIAMPQLIDELIDNILGDTPETT